MAKASKGTVRYLRLTYRAIANRAKFIATMRKSYASAYAKNPEQTEAMIQEAAKWFDWSAVTNVLPNGGTVSRSKRPFYYASALTGKHRSTAGQGEKITYELNWGAIDG